MTTVQLIRMSPDAVVPTKAHDSDAGFDVTLTRVIERDGPRTLYGTGIKVAPPAGTYFTLNGRSSLSKAGYMLANCVGIIDESYRGEIMLVLFKFDASKTDLILPFRAGQLVLCRTVAAAMAEVDVLDVTERGEGGFGSTNN